MSLTNTYVLATNRIPELFKRIQDAQAPDIQFSNQILKDWGFSSSNDRAFIPLLKALGFLSSDGKPSQRYLDYRDYSRSKLVLGQAVKEAYSDIFLIKEHPTQSDKEAIKGKFKSFHNVSDHVASLMTTTFYTLLSLSDTTNNNIEAASPPPKEEESRAPTINPLTERRGLGPTLHYTIQIHLPPTKDLEVYNAIFKSMKEHLLD